jgi:hypothetical protein
VAVTRIVSLCKKWQLSSADNEVALLAEDEISVELAKQFDELLCVFFRCNGSLSVQPVAARAWQASSSGLVGEGRMDGRKDVGDVCEEGRAACSGDARLHARRAPGQGRE